MVWDLGDFKLLLSCFWCLPLESARGNVNCLVCLTWHRALNSLCQGINGTAGKGMAFSGDKGQWRGG